MLANIAERHWPLTAREDLASEAETDAEYFRRRSGEESRAAEKADGLAACTAHTELADLHRLVGRVARNGCRGCASARSSDAKRCSTTPSTTLFPRQRPAGIRCPGRPGAGTDQLGPP